MAALAFSARALLASAALGQDAATLLDQKCFMCHSEDLVAQQRLTPEQWGKVVTKMVGWGAPLAEAEAKVVAAHLAERFTPATPPPRAGTVDLGDVEAARGPEPGPPTGDPARGGPLYRQNCAVCHGLDACGAQASGLAVRAVLRRPSDWRRVIAQGRRGMPAFGARLTESDALDVLAWVRAASSKLLESGPAP